MRRRYTRFATKTRRAYIDAYENSQLLLYKVAVLHVQMEKARLHRLLPQIMPMDKLDYLVNDYLYLDLCYMNSVSPLSEQ